MFPDKRSSKPDTAIADIHLDGPSRIFYLRAQFGVLYIPEKIPNDELGELRQVPDREYRRKLDSPLQGTFMNLHFFITHEEIFNRLPDLHYFIFRVVLESVMIPVEMLKQTGVGPIQ